MKVTIEVDCSPQETRAALGLPEVGSLNDDLTAEIKKRLDVNVPCWSRKR